MASALGQVMKRETDAQKLLGVKGKALAEARDWNTTLLDSSALATHQRYTGVVWQHLDPASLDSSARRRAAKSVVVPSALLGLSGWNDPVPAYKLKMGASLPDIGPLARYWRSAITADPRWKRATAVDLLPNEHAKAVDLDALGFRAVVRVGFIDNERKAVGHFAKAAKGVLARRILEVGDPAEAIEDFAWQDWRGAMVNDHTAVITKR